MEYMEDLLRDNWQYVTMALGAGFILFALVCNRIRLPGFLTRNPDVVYSLGLRIAYLLLGIGALLYSRFYAGG